MAQDYEFKTGDRALERGGILTEDIIRARTYGSEEAPAVLVLGGISATRFVADGERDNRGWWSTLIHPGGPINTHKIRVVGCDFAPGDRSDAPVITTRDQADRLRDLADGLGIKRFAGMIGSSYGGMVALQFAQTYPDRVANLCVIGAAHKPYPIGVAWRGIQRRVVQLGLDAGAPEAGLKLARELAMTTYRTPEEFADRFGPTETGSHPIRFDICDYLGSRGDAFAAHMNAHRFLTLSESIDVHRAEPEKITTPTLLMTAISDRLAPLSIMRELRDRLAGPSELFTFTSLFGHDAFLKEYDMMAPRLAEFCEGLT